MKKRLDPELILLASCIVALLAAASTRWPYFVYVLLRVLICTASAYLGSKRYQERRTPWVWTFAAIALLFNPVFPVRITRPDWRVVNMLGAIFFAVCAVYSIIRAARANRA
jgi:hypothetical protein